MTPLLETLFKFICLYGCKSLPCPLIHHFHVVKTLKKSSQSKIKWEEQKAKQSCCFYLRTAKMVRMYKKCAFVKAEKPAPNLPQTVSDYFNCVICIICNMKTVSIALFLSKKQNFATTCCLHKSNIMWVKMFLWKNALWPNTNYFRTAMSVLNT